jgi:hypothetical protein
MESTASKSATINFHFKRFTDFSTLSVGIKHSDTELGGVSDVSNKRLFISRRPFFFVESTPSSSLLFYLKKITSN